MHLLLHGNARQDCGGSQITREKGGIIQPPKNETKVYADGKTSTVLESLEAKNPTVKRPNISTLEDYESVPAQ